VNEAEEGYTDLSREVKVGLWSMVLSNGKGCEVSSYPTKREIKINNMM
jgi:hypothetical protein